MDLDDTGGLAERARRTAFLLYEGRVTPHRSCGIALAETFGLATVAYQSLRRGGVTGLGECGAIKAGELVLGEFLGDPSPTGAVTPALRVALERYQVLTRTHLCLGAQDATRRSQAAQRLLPLHQVDWNIQCNALTAQHGDFESPARHQFCTRLAADVAALVVDSLQSVNVSPPVKAPPA
jgi:hypothetical protein